MCFGGREKQQTFRSEKGTNLNAPISCCYFPPGVGTLPECHRLSLSYARETVSFTFTSGKVYYLERAVFTRINNF